jgi:hypothetical protein
MGLGFMCVMRECVLYMCVCVCVALSSFIGSPFMGPWPFFVFHAGPIVILVTRRSSKVLYFLVFLVMELGFCCFMGGQGSYLGPLGIGSLLSFTHDL